MTYLDDYNALSPAIREGLNVFSLQHGHPICPTCLGGTPCLECPSCNQDRISAEADDLAFEQAIASADGEPSQELQEQLRDKDVKLFAEYVALATAADKALVEHSEAATDPVERARAAFARIHIRWLVTEGPRVVEQRGAGVFAPDAPPDPSQEQDPQLGDADPMRRDPAGVELANLVVDELPVDDPVWGLWLSQSSMPFQDIAAVAGLATRFEGEIGAFERWLAGSPDPFVSGLARVLEGITRITHFGSTATDEEREQVEDLIRETFADDESRREAAFALLSQFDPGQLGQMVPVGEPAPAFELPSADGAGVVSLAAYAGRPVLLEFTGSWCGPCKFELPYVRRLHEAWAERGVAVVWVSWEPDAIDLEKYLEKNLVTWDVGVWTGGIDGVMADYGVDGVPTFFIIDADGIVLANDLRPSTDKDRIDALLAEALDRAPSAPTPAAGR